MDYFNDSGHLTDYAFKKLVDGEDDELKRLEISEHLDFCDRCIERYMEVLTESTLLSPSIAVSKQVMPKIKASKRNKLINKYATAAIAASFAMVLWSYGAFNIDYERSNDFIKKTNTLITEKTEDFNKNFEEAFFKLYNKIDLKEVFY